MRDTIKNVFCRARKSTAFCAFTALLICIACWLLASAIGEVPSKAQASISVLTEYTDEYDNNYILTSDGKLTVTAGKERPCANSKWWNNGVSWQGDGGASPNYSNPFAQDVTSVELKGVEYIGPGAFAGCNKIASVTLPSACTQVYDYAFAGCSSLQRVNLEKVTYLGTYAFLDCAALKTVECNAYNIGAGAFANCTSLESATFTSTCFEAGTNLQAAFKGCSSLKNVRIPANAVTKSKVVKDEDVFVPLNVGTIDTGADVSIRVKSQKIARIRVKSIKRVKHSFKVEWSTAGLTPQTAAGNKGIATRYTIACLSKNGRPIKTKTVSRCKQGKTFKIRHNATLRGLSPWKNYQVRIKAFNGSVLTGSSKTVLVKRAAKKKAHSHKGGKQ